MVAVVADTHTIVWYLRELPRLSEAALAALDGATAAGDPIYVSSISVANATAPHNGASSPSAAETISKITSYPLPSQ
jgi:hypothetical protein